MGGGAVCPHDQSARHVAERPLPLKADDDALGREGKGLGAGVRVQRGAGVDRVGCEGLVEEDPSVIVRGIRLGG